MKNTFMLSFKRKEKFLLEWFINDETISDKSAFIKALLLAEYKKGNVIVEIKKPHANNKSVGDFIKGL